MRRVLLILTGLTLIPSFAVGCGLDWSLPQAHFDGVEEHGYVAYWEKVGETDLGDGLVIPVNISFNSHREASSPYLGKGWIVALLESHVEPIDENSMNVIMPDGWTFIFLRNGNTETWRGNAGWVGETNNTLFTITAPCGWRVKFDGGKIQEIDTNKNRSLTYKYNGSVATEVDEGGKAFVQVESNLNTGVPADLVVGGRKIDLTLAQRPRIQTTLSQNLITGFDQSLNQLQWPDGTKETFTFGADKSLNPTLAITHPDRTQRNFTWDATTRQIKTDGDWTYKITQNAIIQRINGNKQQELWDYGSEAGSETIVNLAGVKTIRHYFTSGLLAGRTRKIEQVSKGQTKIIYQATYDEHGQILREILEDGSVNQYSNDPSGKKLTETHLQKNGAGYIATFNEYGNISAVKDSTGRTLQYFYDEKGREVKMVIDGKIHSLQSYANDGSWHKEDVYEEDGATLARTFYREFDKQGKTLLDKATEYLGNYPEVVTKYFYNDLGQLEKKIDSQAGTYVYIDAGNGNRIAKLLNQPEVKTGE